MMNSMLSECSKAVTFYFSNGVDQYPKVPELWDHRRYILKTIHDLPRILEEEIEHCYTMCDKYPRNYYAWTTLQMLLPHYSTAQVCAFGKDDRQILDEISRNREFASTHIRDYSALHRRHVWSKRNACSVDPLSTASLQGFLKNGIEEVH